MSQSTSVIDLPAPGQLVEVRRRRYVVQDVEASSLPDHPIGASRQGIQHFVTLSSVEDDSPGEELQVVWEIEPGARVFEAMNLPELDGFDEPERLEAFLNAVRWGAIASADVKSLQSPFRSGVTIEDYQLDPVVRALQMPRVNLLIADDVGLGKTIEAGLVAQELILRRRARTVLVVCPASLQIKWQEEMREKFGLEFRIVDRELMHELRRRRGIHVNPWTHYPRLITSIDYLKRERPLRLLHEVLPSGGQSLLPRRFDLLIVDECHNAAPSGMGRYARDSDRTRAIRDITPHFEHKLFLSATPHNGYAESFGALLELLDNQRFARGVKPGKESLAAVMVRRLKNELPPDWRGKPRFPARKLAALEVDYTAGEQRAHQALQEYTKLRLSDAREQDRFATEFVLMVLKKRLFSSPAAFASTLAKHIESLKEASPQEQARSLCRPPGPLRRLIEETEEEHESDERADEATAEAVAEAGFSMRPPTAREQALLNELQAWAEEAAARVDSRAAILINWVIETCRPGGVWNDQRVLIFTEYRATQKWLQGLLAAHGLTAGDRLLVLYGGMDPQERESIKAAFQASPAVSPVRILLATDCASEGIDLQNHCCRLVHFEIPFNPNRMEQRNGRLDRHGQRADEVLIHHFAPRGFDQRRADPQAHAGDLAGDLEFLARVARKVETIREDLGAVGAVLAKEVSEAMLGRPADLNSASAQKQAAPARRLLGLERDLRAELARLHEQLHKSRCSLRLTPANVQRVVSVGLDLAGQPPLRETRISGPSPGGSDQTAGFTAYYLPALEGSWTSCLEGLRHPHTKEIRPVVFDHDLAAGRDDLVLMHLNHNLVQKCLRLLRAEVWSTGANRKLRRVTACLVPNQTLDAPAVIAYARLLVLGADNHRLHEEVITVGGLIKAGRFSRLSPSKVGEALAQELPGVVSSVVKDELQRLWPGLKGAVIQALEVRMRERSDGLGKKLQERAAREAADLEAVMRELEESIRRELHVPLQIEIDFSEAESSQIERERQRLQDRLARIPQEIEQETATIRARYANPSPRLFPVAIAFLVPERLGR